MFYNVVIGQTQKSPSNFEGVDGEVGRGSLYIRLSKIYKIENN